MQSKSKRITMAYLENATTVNPKEGNYAYLCGMKDKNEIEFDSMIDEAQRDFEAGRFYTTKEVFQEIEEESLEPYTQKELLEMAETGRRQIAEGKCFTTEEVMLHCLTSKSHHRSV